ncbi:hypothetical protein ACU635_42200 [[Actinomadura] parvosata]|uniref:hypothetical protein n=1 Tax=[Actinomadura] parvosata TaxID=1955412 RepID=UPI00406C8F4C
MAAGGLEVGGGLLQVDEVRGDGGERETLRQAPGGLLAGRVVDARRDARPRRGGAHPLAARAAGQIRAGETILLDAGSTTGALAHELRHAADLTIATTGLNALQELVGATGVHVECLGGTLRQVSQASSARWRRRR